MSIELNQHDRAILALRWARFDAQDAAWCGLDNEQLDRAVAVWGTGNWRAVASSVRDKTAVDCKERFDRLCWTGDEDRRLRYLARTCEGERISRAPSSRKQPKEGDQDEDTEMSGFSRNENKDDDANYDGENGDAWRYISLFMANKDPIQCLRRWRTINWTPDEDAVLRHAVATCGRRQWGQVAIWLPAKAPWQCEERWALLNGTTSSQSV